MECTLWVNYNNNKTFVHIDVTYTFKTLFCVFPLPRGEAISIDLTPTKNSVSNCNFVPFQVNLDMEAQKNKANQYNHPPLFIAFVLFSP